jgi:hypothetical protein
MAASDAVKVLIDSLTDGGVIYAKGQVVFDPSDALLAVAEEKRMHNGVLIAKKLSKGDALKAAKRAEAGEEVVDPTAQVPMGDGEDDEGEE